LLLAARPGRVGILEKMMLPYPELRGRIFSAMAMASAAVPSRSLTSGRKIDSTGLTEICFCEDVL
jgi:hypothetical protein